jgi:hypothetical protein
LRRRRKRLFISENFAIIYKRLGDLLEAEADMLNRKLQRLYLGYLEATALS